MESASHEQHLTDIIQEYLELGLPFPPVPKDMAHQLRKVAPHTYSTSRMTEQPIDTATLISQLPDTSNPLLAFGLNGHGINSQVFYYALICNQIAMFLEQPLSQLGESSDSDLQQLTERLGEFEQLYLGAAYLYDERLLKDKRLVVMVNGQGPSRLATLDANNNFDLLEESNSVTQTGAQWLEAHLQTN